MGLLDQEKESHQITPQYCCERFITAVLSECHCSSHVSKQSVFNRLSSMSVSHSAKRRRSRTRRTFSDREYPEVTANMIGPSTMPSRTKGKKIIVSSDESDTEPEGVHRQTRTQTGVTAPADYSALAWGIEVSESHSSIVESQASNSSVDKEAFVYMAGTPKEMARRFEQQAQV